MEDKDRYIRWQQIRIDQMGKVINLILGLATFNLGFLVNFLSKKDLVLNCCQLTFFIIVLLIVIASIILGLLLSMNRLYDFRWTAKIVGIDDNIITEDKHDSAYYKNKADKNSDKTWPLLWWHLGLFILGLILSVIFILINY